VQLRRLEAEHDLVDLASAFCITTKEVLHLRVACCKVQRAPAVSGPDPNVGAALEKTRGNPGVSFFDREVERGQTLSVNGINHCATRQEEIDSLQLSAGSCIPVLRPSRRASYRPN